MYAIFYLPPSENRHCAYRDAEMPCTIGEITDIKKIEKLVKECDKL
jgi:hypothetical protein